MKKFLTVLMSLMMCLTCVFGLTACGDNDPRQTLQVYTNAGFAPYEYVNEYGEVVGVDIDIMKEVGAILGYKVVVNDIEFDQILVEVGKNELAVGAAGMTQREDRDAVALPSISYTTSVQYVIVPVGTFGADDLVGGKLPVSKLAELSNTAIGVQEGTTGHFMIDDAISLEEGDLYETNTVLTYSNAIIASGDIGATIGAVVIDKLPAQSIASGNANLEAIELVAEPESYVLYFNKNATELATKVNAIIQNMIDNGVIEYFTLKHSGGIV